MSETVSTPASDAETDTGEDNIIYIRTPDGLAHGLGLVIIETPRVVEVAAIRESRAEAFKKIDWTNPVASARLTDDVGGDEESNSDYSWQQDYWLVVREAVTSDTPVVKRGDEQ